MSNFRFNYIPIINTYKLIKTNVLCIQLPYSQSMFHKEPLTQCDAIPKIRLLMLVVLNLWDTNDLQSDKFEPNNEKLPHFNK